VTAWAQRWKSFCLQFYEAEPSAWVSSLSGKCPAYWLLTDGEVSLWSFNQKFSPHQTTAYSFPKLQLRQRNIFQGTILNPFLHTADRLSRKRSLPSCSHHQLLNLEAKLTFSLRERKRSQRLQLAGHKHRMAGESHPIASSNSSAQSATSCFLPPKKCIGHFDILSL